MRRLAPHDQIQAEHKERNGQVAVFSANIQKELFDRQRFYDLDRMKRRLATHLRGYNHARTHQRSVQRWCPSTGLTAARRR